MKSRIAKKIMKDPMRYPDRKIKQAMHRAAPIIGEEIIWKAMIIDLQMFMRRAGLKSEWDLAS